MRKKPTDQLCLPERLRVELLGLLAIRAGECSLGLTSNAREEVAHARQHLLFVETQIGLLERQEVFSRKFLKSCLRQAELIPRIAFYQPGATEAENDGLVNAAIAPLVAIEVWLDEAEPVMQKE